MKKKIFAILTATTLIVSMVAGCSNSGGATGGNTGSSTTTDTTKKDDKSNVDSKAIPIKMAYYYAETHPAHIALETIFKPMIEEKSGGRYVVELYPNNTLGAEKEFTEATRLGTVESCLIGALLSEQYPIFKVIDFPWVFDDVETASKALNSEEISTEIYDAMEEAGLVGRGFTVNGVRAISNNVRPINTIEDCKGLKLRFPELDYYVDNVKALGCNPITMSMSEIFTALQQGVIDGQENPPTTVLTSGWYEVQPYLAIDRHQISFNMITFSKTFWDKLSDEDKAILEEACVATVEEQLKLYVNAEKADIEILKEKGIEVTEPDRTSFKAAGESVVEKYSNNFPEFKEIVEKVRAKEAEFK